MDITDAEIGVDIPEISQLAFVVDDLDAAMERYRRMFGLEPWDVYYLGPPEHEEGRYHGEKADPSFEIGYAHRGNLEIELIEPVDGRSVHRDFLAESGGGVHHVGCFEFEEPYAVAASLEDAGIPLVQEGKWYDTHYMYFDTVDVLGGLYFEILAGGKVDPGPTYTFPPESDGADRP